MRQVALLLFALFAAAGWSEAAEAKILKVLPHHLDAKGRHTLSPSLYERDAYQQRLRQNPRLRSGLRFDVQWKAPRHQREEIKVVVELRGAKGSVISSERIESSDAQFGWFSHWSSATLTGPEFRKFGDMTAWRVTLWQGDRVIDEQRSFLW